MSILEKYKQNRQSSLDKLTQELQKINQPSYGDDRYWQPTVDNQGNGSAVIRFLPAHVNEDVPFVRFWEHAFKNEFTNKWYIEKCLTSLGEDDPVVQYNNILYASKDDDKIKQAKDQKRKLYYVANVYVVDDPAKPENNGKVKLYKFGQKIWDKINKAMNESDPDERVKPFDILDEGANFKIEICKVAGYRNYDGSRFLLRKKGPLSNDEDMLESVLTQISPLQELVSPDKFKPYDRLKKRLMEVLGEDEVDLSVAKHVKTTEVSKHQFDEDDDIPFTPTSRVSKKDDVDVDMDYFKNLVDD